MSPRCLRLLLIEDWAIEVDELPVQLLGRIGHWAPFVSNLSRLGRIPVPVAGNSGRDEDAWEPISDPPELIAIDFRFEKDSTSPMGQGQEWRNPPQFPYCHWSNHLDAPNSGILIGAIAMGCTSQSDLPVSVALYSGDTSSVASDVSTVLLLGGMMAASGLYFPPSAGSHPFEMTRRFLRGLPRNPVSAVIANMWRFRVALLERLGADANAIVRMLQSEYAWADDISGDDADIHHLKENVKSAIADDRDRRKPTGAVGTDESRGVPQLFVMPEKLVPLLCVLDSTATDSEEGLDAKLERVGIEFFDRDGALHCIDLRSLFLDKLTVPKPGRRWGMFPISTVQPTPNRGPLVRELIDTIYKSATQAFEKAAALVQSNSAHLRATDTKSCTEKNGYELGTQMWALLFATIEETVAGSAEYRQSLGRSWDLDSDSERDSGPTLRELLRQFGIAWDSLASYLVADAFPEDGYLPLSSADGRSIREAFANMREGSSNAFVTLLYPDGSEGGTATARRDRIIKNALDHLCELDLAEVETRDKRKYYRVVPNRYALRTTHYPYPRANAQRVANRLGFWPDPTEYGQVDRILKGCGCTAAATFRNRLLDLCMPPWMQEAGAWYLRNFHSEVERKNWPVFRT